MSKIEQKKGGKMGEILYTDKEIMLLLKEGVRAQIYCNAPLEMTKGEIELKVEEILKGITSSKARKILSLKVQFPDIDLIEEIEKRKGNKWTV